MNKISNFDEDNIEYLKMKIEKEKKGNDTKKSYYTLIEGEANVGAKVSISDINRKIVADILVNSK